MSNVLITFKVTPEAGEPFIVRCTSRDILMWEKTGHGNSYADLMRRQDMRPMYAIAHLTARRLGLYTNDLATFEVTCDLEPLEPTEDEESNGEPDPTRLVPSTTPR